MKKLFISIIFVTIAFFITDRIGGEIMWWVNQHTQDVSGPKIRYLADEVNEDIVLLGTSRCNLHYVPSILSDSIGLSVYNGGIDASNNIYAHYFALNLILQHHTPKFVFLELMTSDYAQSDNSFETTSFFAPYIGKSKQGDSIFIEAGNYWYYKISHLYRYNAKAVSNIGGLLVNKQQGEDNGYLPQPKPTLPPQELEEAHTPTNVDSLKLKYVQKFINLCRSKDIKLVFMVSPAYTIADSDLYDVLKIIAKTNDIPFLDYHTKGLFLDHPEYFKDASHLWDKGARIYSSIFAHDLKNIIQ